MAGIPGSGKTEFVQSALLKDFTDLVSIEHDKIVEYIKDYHPEDYYKYRTAGSTLVSLMLKECINNDFGFVFDGTLSHRKGISNIKRTLSKGYEVLVIYIIQDAKQAWSLTKDRRLTTKRAVDIDGFINTCAIINSNLGEVFARFKDNNNFSIWIFDKTNSDTTGNANSIIYNNGNIGTSEDIEKALRFSYNTTHNGSVIYDISIN